MDAAGTLDPEEADRLERRWRARLRLLRPAIALSWMGLTAFVLHAGLAPLSLVVLATSDFVAGTGGQPWQRLTATDVMAAASTGTSMSWLFLAPGLIAGGLAMRSGQHRTLVQAGAVATMPLGALAIAELAWLAPCSVPGVVLGSAFHVSLAVLGGWLALHLARPVGRDGFEEERHARSAQD